MPIKAVVFDFGGVILAFDKLGSVWEECDRNAGLPVGTIASEVKGTSFTEWLGGGRGMFTGSISVEEVENGLFADYIKEKYNATIPAGFKFISPCLIDKRFISLSKKINILIPQLKDHGLKSALLTNNCHIDIAQKVPRLPYDTSVFNVVVESCLEGVMKPDPKIYQICSERLGLEPSELVFLDDLKENCDAAIALGWKAIQVNLAKEDEAVQQLEELLNVKFKFDN